MSSGTSTGSLQMEFGEELPAPVRGKADWREFQCFRLKNGVTVCLVHDKESKTTAAAATVTVGAASDPRNMSGLARKYSNSSNSDTDWMLHILGIDTH